MSGILFENHFNFYIIAVFEKLNLNTLIKIFVSIYFGLSKECAQECVSLEWTASSPKLHDCRNIALSFKITFLMC